VRWKNNIFLWTHAFFVIFNTFFHILCQPNFKWHCMFFFPFPHAFHFLHLMPIFWTNWLIELSFLNCVWTCTSFGFTPLNVYTLVTQVYHYRIVTICKLSELCYECIHPSIHFIDQCLFSGRGKFFFLRICFIKYLEKPSQKGHKRS